jgi:hypothetical protein
LFNSIFKPPIGIKRVGSGLIFFPYGLIDLLSQYSDFPRRGNAEPDLIAAHSNHSDNNIVANGKTLPESAT